MSIAEQLVRIAEREERVYNAGYWNGHSVGEDDGIAQGEKKERDRFWDAYQENGNRQAYNYAFAGFAWSDETYGTIKYNMQPNDLSNTFYYNYGITDTVIEIDCYYCGTLNSTFNSAKALRRIPSLKVVSWNSFSSTFKSCFALEELGISGTIARNGLDLRDSTLLNKSSIEKIITCLSSTTSDLSVTLSKTAVDNAFEDGSTGNEWLNLIATKSNWTISLA